MIIPANLKPKDKVAIVAPAGKISDKAIDYSIDIFKEWGLRVKLGKNIFNNFNQFSSNDINRTIDFQDAIDDDSVKAIICARGGYGTARIIDSLDFESFSGSPKWIVGFSDITVLHSALNKMNVATIHGTMPVNFESTDIFSLETLKQVLFGKQLAYEIEPVKYNKLGETKAQLVGGNLSIIYSLRGTAYDLNFKNKILFFEDLSEYLYHIDRIMQNFKLSGVFKQIKGLIIGGMSDLKDNEMPFGKNIEEIILEAVKEYNFPVLFNFPAGHIEKNYSLVLGSNVKLKVDKSICKLEF